MFRQGFFLKAVGAHIPPGTTEAEEAEMRLETRIPVDLGAEHPMAGRQVDSLRGARSRCEEGASAHRTLEGQDVGGIGHNFEIARRHDRSVLADGGDRRVGAQRAKRGQLDGSEPWGEDREGNPVPLEQPLRVRLTGSDEAVRGEVGEDGGGAAVPGMTLRQFGKAEFLGGLSYSGGIEDPAAWNHFVTEGRLRDDFEGLDIHISCPIPSDPEQTRKALFYSDDVSLQAIEEPPLAIATPLDEYYVGESIHWTVRAAQPGGQVKAVLLAGIRAVAELAYTRQGGPVQGDFTTRGLVPGIYTIQATRKDAQGNAHTARRQIIAVVGSVRLERKGEIAQSDASYPATDPSAGYYISSPMEYLSYGYLKVQRIWEEIHRIGYYYSGQCSERNAICSTMSNQCADQ